MLTPNESMGNVTTDTKPIRPIAIVGTGVMGASWSAQFLAKRALRIGIPIATSVQEIQLTFPYFQTYRRKQGHRWLPRRAGESLCRAFPKPT